MRKGKGKLKLHSSPSQDDKKQEKFSRLSCIFQMKLKKYIIREKLIYTNSIKRNCVLWNAIMKPVNNEIYGTQVVRV